MRFTVPGEPVPKARPRVVRRRDGGVNAITPASTERYGRKVAMVARTEGVTPADGPVALWVTFYMPTRRRADVDNLAKAVMDGLNGVAYADDSQVEELFVCRRVDPTRPRADVRIEPVRPGEETG